MDSIELLPARERFLPFRPAAMLERFVQDPRLTPEERDLFRMLSERVHAHCHVEFHRQEERLQDLYDPWDPDRDTLPEAPPEPQQRERQRDELCHAFRRLLTEGHYRELPRRQIVECVELQVYGGLKVEANLDQYLDLAVYFRGAERRERTIRLWRYGWRKQTQACTVFRRAAVLVRTAEQPERVHLKLFKDIVAEDLEMVLPQVRVRMRLIDGVKIGSGLAGSLGTAAWKAFMATFWMNSLVFLVMLGTFLMAMVRAIFSYTASKSHYMQLLSSNLYYQNLANNASVLTQLIDAAENEETKELLLAYFILYVERERDYTTELLGRRVRQWVRDEFGREIEFDARETVRTLIERGLATERFVSGDPRQWSQSAAEGTVPPPCLRVLKVYDLPSALRRLDKAWDGLYPQENDAPPDVDRVADGKGQPAAEEKGVGSGK